MGIARYRLAQTLFVPAWRIKEIMQAERAISPDTAVLFSRALGVSERFWMNLQSPHDLATSPSRGLARSSIDSARCSWPDEHTRTANRRSPAIYTARS